MYTFLVISICTSFFSFSSYNRNSAMTQKIDTVTTIKAIIFIMQKKSAIQIECDRTTEFEMAVHISSIE